jgi:hypothetical protein
MKRLFPLTIIIAVLLSACSPGDDVLNTGDPQLDPSDQPSLDYTFKGVWMVDDIKDAEAYSRAIIGFKGENLISSGTYPYATIMEELFPEVKVAKICNTSSESATPSPEEALWEQTVMSHGTDLCLMPTLGVPYRCIGVSDQSIYLEMMPSITYGILYLPFVVTKDDGTLMTVVLTIAPTQSTALLDKSGASLSNRLTVTQVETIIDGQSETKRLNPTMQLRFTSIERVK